MQVWCNMQIWPPTSRGGHGFGNITRNIHIRWRGSDRSRTAAVKSFAWMAPLFKLCYMLMDLTFNIANYCPTPQMFYCQNWYYFLALVVFLWRELVLKLLLLCLDPVGDWSWCHAIYFLPFYWTNINFSNINCEKDVLAGRQAKNNALSHPIHQCTHILTALWTDKTEVKGDWSYGTCLLVLQHPSLLHNTFILFIEKSLQ